MNARIITIGDEILIGQIIDTNSSWIATEFNKIGINILGFQTVSDDVGNICKTIEYAVNDAELLVITGGLGPTNDDKTKEALCNYFNVKTELHEESLHNIKRIFEQKGVELTEINIKQAETLTNCIPIINRNGTAPAMWIEDKGKYFIVLPGVPFEMKQLMINSVLPQLEKLSKQFISHKTFSTYGIGESFLSEKLNEFEKLLPNNFKLAYLPNLGIVRIRLSAIGYDSNEIQYNLKLQSDKIKTIISEYIWCEDDLTIEETILNLLKEKSLTISFAESCTGGYLSHLITSISGSSAVFKGSSIVYSNEAKINILRVNYKTIDEYGVVSEQVVIEMAKNVSDLYKTNCSVAISGIAGPIGATENKQVGTVCIAVKVNEKIFANTFYFSNNREINIKRSAVAALMMLYKEIK